MLRFDQIAVDCFQEPRQKFGLVAKISKSLVLQYHNYRDFVQVPHLLMADWSIDK
jgi:hypothetical protein